MVRCDKCGKLLSSPINLGSIVFHTDRILCSSCYSEIKSVILIDDAEIEGENHD